MAYTDEYLIKESLRVIEEKNLFFIGDIFGFVEFHEATFYRHKCEDCKDIKAALKKNRIFVKHELRKKWRDGDNATTQIALMKLICTEQERKNISQTHQDVTSKGNIIKPIEWNPGEAKGIGEDLEDEC